MITGAWMTFIEVTGSICHIYYIYFYLVYMAYKTAWSLWKRFKPCVYDRLLIITFTSRGAPGARLPKIGKNMIYVGTWYKIEGQFLIKRNTYHLSNSNCKTSMYSSVDVTFIMHALQVLSNASAKWSRLPEK